MMRQRILPVLAIFMLLALTVTGAFATWIYYYDPEPLEQGLESYMGEFAWEPEEILPTESELGKNHLALIELILNENNKGYGLNYDKKQVLESYLNSVGIIFSNQKTTKGNMKFVSDETKALYDCVEKITDTMYYAYTFVVADLRGAAGTADRIPVYRTVLEKTDKWRAPKSYFGYASTIPLSALSVDSLPGEFSYTINVDTWRP